MLLSRHGLLSGLLLLLLISVSSDAWRIHPKLHRRNLAVQVVKRGGSSPSDHFSDSAHHETEEEISEDSDSKLDSELDEISSNNERGLNDTQPTSNDAVEEQLLVDDPTIDDDSSANIDRMEYADAYDEEDEENTSTGYDSSDYASTSTEVLADNMSDNNDENKFGDAPKIHLSPTVTNEMKEIMTKELDYKLSDIDAIRPEIASIIVAKEVRRPLEGLPTNWYKDGYTPKESTGRARKIAITCLVGAVAIALGSKIGELDMSLLTERLATRKNTRGTLDISTTSPDETFEYVLTTEEQVNATLDASEREDKEEESDYSIRPGQEPSGDIDELWLDKIITAVGSVFKKLFRL